jgi:HSP20 family molecular chaperone IbpA
MALPAGVKAGEITASFTDGVLEVRVPKAEQATPRKITISPQS